MGTLYHLQHAVGRAELCHLCSRQFVVAAVVAVVVGQESLQHSHCGTWCPLRSVCRSVIFVVIDVYRLRTVVARFVWLIVWLNRLGLSVAQVGNADSCQQALCRDVPVGVHLARSGIVTPRHPCVARHAVGVRLEGGEVCFRRQRRHHHELLSAVEAERRHTVAYVHCGFLGQVDAVVFGRHAVGGIGHSYDEAVGHRTVGERSHTVLLEQNSRHVTSHD